ncbi:MAG: hypothetical protein IK094_08635 [Treponema sp.]|nr:hypothetical protein [Treponema sp.]
MAAGFVAALFMFASCSLSDGADSPLGQVSFSLDETAVQNIKAKALSRSVSYEGVSAASDLFMEISLQGDWQESAEIPVSNGSTATFDSVPTGLSVYVKATVFKKEAAGRHDILFGRSSQFVVQSGKNNVSLVLGTANPQTPNGGEPNSDPNGGSGGGSGGGGAEPGNIYIYVAASANGTGLSDADPLGSIYDAADYLVSLETAGQNLSAKDVTIYVMGTLVEPQAIYQTINVKSLTVEGLNGIDAATGEPQDVINASGTNPPAFSVASQGLNLTIKNLKITNGDSGLSVGEYDPQTFAPISSSVVLDCVYITNCMGMGNGIGIYICENSSVTMKDGCLVDNNVSGSGVCGGVYIDNGSFFMQGGTISGSQGKDGNAAVYVGGRFEISGDASIPEFTSSNGPANTVTVLVEESVTTPGTYEVLNPVIIAGDLTQSAAATIYPKDINIMIGGGPIYQIGLQCVTEASSGLLLTNHNKIQVVQDGSANIWIVNDSGCLGY